MDPIVVAVFAIVVFILVVIVYNQFITLGNQTKNAWADIDVLLKRRYDLIPNLVDVVKQYSQYEGDIFEKVTKARQEALTSSSIKDKEETNNQISQGIKSIFAIAENYPQLKASDNYQKLQEELTQTEDDLAQARRFYNANVRDLNTKVETFPYNLFAKTFGFKNYDFFQADGEEKKDISV